MQTNNLSLSMTRNISIYYLLPLLVGGAIAAVVCLDSFVTNFTVIGEELEILASFPYLFSALVILACFAIPFCLRGFWKRNQMLIIGMIVSIHLGAIVFGGSLELHQLFIYVFLVFWSLKVLLRGESVFISSPTFILTIALFSFIVLSSAYSMAMSASVRGIFGVLTHVIILFFLVLNCIKTRKLLLDTIHFLFIATLLTSLVAIGQWVIWYITGASLSAVSIPADRFTLTPYGMFFRSSAFMAHPNSMAGILSPSLTLMLYFAVSPNFSRKMRMFYFFGVVLSALAIVLAFSRSSWIGVLLACAILPYLKKPSLWLHYTAALIALASFGLAIGFFGAFSDFLASFNPGSVSQRSQLMKQAIMIFLDRPLMGCGLYAFTAYPDIEGALVVHSATLQVFSECGLFAGLLYCSIFFATFIRLVRSVVRTEQAQEKAILKGMTLSFIVLFIEIQFDVFTFLPSTWMYISLFESAILIYSRRETPQESRLNRQSGTALT